MNAAEEYEAVEDHEAAEDYEIRCRECDYRRVVSQEEIHRVVVATSGTGHKLAISSVDG